MALSLACVSCAGVSLPQGLHWIPVAPPLADLDSAWDATHEVMAAGLRVKAMNSGQDLHLRFETDDRVLQDEFSGQYGQSVLLWFAAKNAGPGHGLRIDFKPKADISPLADPINMMDRVVTLLGPPGEGYPRPWADGSEGIELSAIMASGTLVYELRLPLGAGTPGAFALGLKPGDPVLVSIEASAFSADNQGDGEAAGMGASGSAGGGSPSPGGRRHRGAAMGSAGPRFPSAAYSTLLSVVLAKPPYSRP